MPSPRPRHRRPALPIPCFSLLSMASISHVTIRAQVRWKKRSERKCIRCTSTNSTVPARQTKPREKLSLSLCCFPPLFSCSPGDPCRRVWLDAEHRIPLFYTFGTLCADCGLVAGPAGSSSLFSLSLSHTLSLALFFLFFPRGGEGFSRRRRVPSRE